MFTQPRFVAYAFGSYYDDRDVRHLDHFGTLVATAETELWLHKQLDSRFGDDEDVHLQITDNAPRSAWSVEISQQMKRREEDERSLPF